MKMKACIHFKSPLGNTYLHQGSCPCDAWVYVYDESGKLVYSSFETCEFFSFLQHLLDNRNCRKEVGITKKEVLRQLSNINREWKAAFSLRLDISA